jgi:hypothetical protein
MASTNKTPNYNLPQWIGTDHPTFSGDFNGAFSAIDTAMNSNKSAAESAQATATAAQSTAQTAQSTAESAQAASANATRVSPMTCDAFDNMYIMVGNQPPED